MNRITLSQADYLNRVRGCWTGKNIGGTLGEPFEWIRQLNDVSFYTQDLKGQAAPNDDLDIQLLWLIALEERGPGIDAHILADYWCLYVTPHWNEYGRAKVNMRSGLLPPLCGSFDNVYKHSCGAFIRSEIWACVAPGLPGLAAWYAFQDGILDHGDGEGTYAAVFCAATESAAFAIPDLRQVIEIGLSHIPDDCGTVRAVRTAVELADAGTPVAEARRAILEQHRGAAARPQSMSPEEVAAGLAEGEAGYDAPSNVAITVYALLHGGDDFGAVQCAAVNCGEDTDCTAATAGALWGILHGYDAIPARWIDPIGDAILTVTLNKGDLGHFGCRIPQTVTELTERTLAAARRVLAEKGQEAVCLVSEGTSSPAPDPAQLRSRDRSEALFRGLRGPVFEFPFFRVEVDYHGDPVIRNGCEKRITVTIHNTYKPQANLACRWHLPDGWSVSPGQSGYASAICGRFARPAVLDCRFTAGSIDAAVNHAVLEITAAGRPTVMHVPVTLLNGNLLAREKAQPPIP